MSGLLAVLLWLSAGAASAAEVPVTVDPRLETLGIVQMLAGGVAPHGFRIPPGEYGRRARAAFDAFRGHPAVALTAALPPAFEYRDRTDVLLRRADLPDLGPRLFTPDVFMAKAGGREKFDAWIAALADFARVAHVAEFVRDNASALDPSLSAFRADVAKRDYVATLERYAGFPLDGRYEVHAAPFILSGSQDNAVLRLDDGTYLIVSVVGPDENGAFRSEDFVATAGHELAHGLIDTLGDLHHDKIERAAGVYGALPWACYNDWLQCAKEDFVRAVMLRLIDAELGPQAATRQLNEEGRAKWPYLERSAALLKEYEAHRDRWPNLAAFYPNLVAVFPADASSAAAGRAELGTGPGPEWVYEETRPFATPGQRALALRYLDRALAAAPDPVLLRRRAAFRLLADDAAAAEADARAAVAADPNDPAAHLAYGLASARLGRPERAREEFSAALQSCRAAPASASTACASARRAAEGGGNGFPSGGEAALGPDPSVGPNPALAPGAGTAAANAEPAVPGRPQTVDYEFVVDPRIELLGAAFSLAAPGGQPVPAEFASLADHPAVRRLKSVLAAGASDIAPTQLMLHVGPPPELSPNGPLPSGVAAPFGGEAGAVAFLADLRAFAAAAGWSSYWQRRAEQTASAVRRGREETRRTLSPEGVEDWFGVRFKDRYRFIVSDTLPNRAACNDSFTEDGRRVDVRLRSVMGWRNKSAYFSFDDFAGSVAHELTHTITDPVILDHQSELAAFSALMVPRCTDSWTGCVMEHVVIGATLRALRREKGEAAYAATLKDYSGRGFPYLPAVTERLAEFEAPEVRARGFAAFYPRVADVFRAALRERFHVQAQANVASKAAAPRAPEPYSLGFAADPRVELAVVLHRLALPPGARAQEAGAAPEYAARLDARFRAFASHPAVAQAARLEASAGERGLPASLLIHLSSGPELTTRVPVPAGYLAAGGGEAAVAAWFDSVRDFARVSGFFGFWKSEEPYHARLAAQARAEAARAVPPKAVASYLGRPLEGRLAYALSPLYPDSYPTRLAVFRADGAEVVRPRASRVSADGAPRFGFDEDEGSVALQIAYDEASRLIPGPAGSPAGLAESCADRRGASWPACEREHLATAVLLRAGAGRKARADVALPYLDALLRTFSVYESSRAAYPTLADFWPVAEKAFGPESLPAASDPGAVAARADFVVDPRAELAATLLRLAGAGKGGASNDERRLADERFAAFADHPAVARAAVLSRGAGAGQTVLRLALSLGDLPELAVTALPPEPWLSAAGGEEGFRRFASDLREFVRVSGFASFYDAARPLHRAFVEEARAEAARGPDPRTLTAYAGVESPRATFLLTGLVPSSYGTDFTMSAGTSAVRMLFRPAQEGPGPARFGFDTFGDSLVHELAHGVLDPAVPADFRGDGKVPKGCNDANAEPSWRACAQEYLVYAVTIRLLALDQGEAAAAARAAAYAERGYPRLPQMVERLRQYERLRDREPLITAFVPRLLSVLGSQESRRESARLTRAQSLIERGVAKFLAGDATSAVALLRSAGALVPDDAEAALDLGVALDKTGDAAGAVKAYTKAVDLALSASQRRWEIAAAALSSRADLLLRQGRAADARADLKKALGIVPPEWKGRADLQSRYDAVPGGR